MCPISYYLSPCPRPLSWSRPPPFLAWYSAPAISLNLLCPNHKGLLSTKPPKKSVSTIDWTIYCLCSKLSSGSHLIQTKSQRKSSSWPVKPCGIWPVAYPGTHLLPLFPSPTTLHTGFLAVPQNCQAHTHQRPFAHAVHAA